MTTETPPRLREFTFSIHYETEADPVVDAFYDQPELTASAIDICTGDSSYVRLHRIQGPTDAADRLEALLDERDHLPRAVGHRPCRGTGTSFSLECTTHRRLIYSYVEGIRSCESVQGVVCSTLSRGTVCEVHQREGVESWRLLMRSDENVGLVYERLEANLRDGLSLEVGHLGEAAEWHSGGIVDAGLTGTQLQAVQEAAARGYYERPREITVEALAAKLDVPPSTLSYRLRMAEATLVKRYLERFGDTRK